MITVTYHANFHYTPCVLEGEAVEGGVVGNLTEEVLNVSSSFKDWLVYLCGNPDIVKDLRKKVFLQGASPQKYLCRFLLFYSRANL